MHQFSRLLGYVRPYWAAFLISFMAAVLASSLDGLTFALLIPFLRTLFGAGAPTPEVATGVERLLATLVGGWVDPAGGSSALQAIVLLILITVVVKNVAGYTSAYLGAFIQERVAADLRVAAYAHVQKLGLGFYQRTKAGQLVTRVVVDADQAKSVVSGALTSAFQHAVLVAVYVVILFTLSWRLTLVALVLAPALALVLRPVLAQVRSRFQVVLHERGELTAIMTETIDGVRLVKAHGAEVYERRRFSRVLQRYVRGLLATQRFAILASPLSETLGAGVIVLVLMLGVGGLTGGPALRPEIFVAFLAVTLRLMPPVKSLSQFPTVAQQALAAARRVFELLDTATDDLDSPAARPFPGLAREIRFDDVWFAYEPEGWVLKGVNLAVYKGDVIAIVGPSGAGKSTLVDLLPRFVVPARGAVLVDDVSISSYSRRSLRKTLGIVSQHTVIFNDSVRANIAYGDEADASMEAVTAAARAANAHGFVERLPNGYETLLGERGTRLSGGERQRIAIARALLRDPPILILDEATSALDSESERLVQQAIQRLLENRTVLVIAHRLSTVSRADRIVVLDRGRIVEQGRHADLIQAGGLYQRLHTLELAASDS